MTASSRLMGKPWEDRGWDGWLDGREDLDSQEPQDAIASAMVQKRMRVVCRYETLGQKLDQKYLFPTGTSSIPRASLQKSDRPGGARALRCLLGLLGLLDAPRPLSKPPPAAQPLSLLHLDGETPRASSPLRDAWVLGQSLS